jgi:PilZ domain
MTDEGKNAGPGPSGARYAVPRRERRLPVPAVYQRYLHLKVKRDDVFVPVVLHDFSGIGILFESPGPFEIESHVDCVISISQLLSKEIVFGIRVKHCEKKNNAFFVGAAIETAGDATWFNVFKEIHDFIMQRKGDVY